MQTIYDSQVTFEPALAGESVNATIGAVMAI